MWRVMLNKGVSLGLVVSSTGPLEVESTDSWLRLWSAYTLNILMRLGCSNSKYLNAEARNQCCDGLVGEIGYADTVVVGKGS